MAVQQSDLSFKLPTTSSDTAAQNGGRLTAVTATSAVFPNITGAERAAGKTRLRKLFLKNEAGTATTPPYADPTLTLFSSRVFLENISAAGNYYLMKAGTATDFQSGVVDSGWAGSGFLDANVSAGATSLAVRCELNGSTGEIFQNGGVVLISEYVNGVGARELVTLDSPGGVAWGAGGDSNKATLTFTATPLQNGYNRNALAADRTADIYSSTTIGYTLDSMTVNEHVGRRVRIKSGTGSGQIRRVVSNTVTTLTVEYGWTTTPDGTSVYEVLKTYGCQCVSTGDIVASYANVVATTAGNGDFVPSGNLKLIPIGTRDDQWTLLFTGATTFTITGTHYGALPGTYSTASTTRPVNGSSYYFEIASAGWTGTWAAGDTLVFDTISSSKAIWLKEVVPAGIAAHLSNTVDIGAVGDTV